MGPGEEVTAVTTTDVEVDALRQALCAAAGNETQLNESHGLLRVVNREELRTVDGNKHHDLRGNQGGGKTQLASICANVRDTNGAHEICARSVNRNTQPGYLVYGSCLGNEHVCLGLIRARRRTRQTG